MAENATLFVVYNQTQALLRRLDPPPPTGSNEEPHLNLVHLGTAAALAGSCASFVLTPVELVKCKMQVQGSIAPSVTEASRPIQTGVNGAQSAAHRASQAAAAPRPAPGPVAITRQILHQDGFRGLWLGQTGTFLRETGGSAAWFTTFELATRALVRRRIAKGQTHSLSDPTRRLSKGDLSAVELMASGATAGVVYNVVLFPADCIKSTIQTEDELRGVGQRRSFMQVGKDIYRARGVKGLYQGCGLTALRAAPSSALIFYMWVFPEEARFVCRMADRFVACDSYSRLESIFG